MSFSRERIVGRRLWSLVKTLARKSVVVVLAMCVVVQSARQGVTADKPPEVLEAIRKGAEYLQKNAAVVTASEAGLVAYTLLSAGIPAEDPGVKALIEKVVAKFGAEGYQPTAHHNYEAGVDAMALSAADKVKYKDKLQLIADYLVKNQRSNGSWDYFGQEHGGDTSISQYGMLGLWAAARAGVVIPQKTLDMAAVWHLRTQNRNGGWSYQPLGGDVGLKHSMTVAGIGTLGIARLLMSTNPQALESLAEEEAKPKKVEKAFGVLEKVNPKDEPEKPAGEAAPVDAAYKPQVSRTDMDAAMKRGLGWISANYTVDKNALGWHLYYLYGLERAASLANVERIGGRDWYTDGYRVLLKLQESDGSFNNLGGIVPSTCFAVLFLTRATEKLVPNAPPPRPTPKAPTFGGGLLAGGRGLPTDMANVEAKDGNIKARKLDTPLDQLLAELENPKSEKIESAQAALVEAVQVGQREQLIGQKDLLLKLAKDARVDVRRTAFWALGRCNDLRVAPVLIQGLMDADFDAAVEARNALCVLSRRPRGFGLPDDLIAKLPENASQAEKESAFEKWRDDDVRRWREWYQSVRPYSERDKLPD
jgi:hypothetical protein